ncbi:MAG: primosomal protein N' [Gammaproteobacteria bacterium RIFCSPLOWO2_02_FULL_56_15]|nr:MAG: primosomal protein N' [Gammaproteobacteria bacterium RIFCSPLOWO2_02_FULL_56_15]
MPARRRTVLHVALPVPIRRMFDYLLPDDLNDGQILPGMRVRVPFGKSVTRTGLVTGVSHSSQLDHNRLKKVISVLDESPLFPKSHMTLINWASSYYQYSAGEVYFNSLPVLLRQGKQAVRQKHTLWKLTEAGKEVDPASLKRAPLQRRFLELMQQNLKGLDPGNLQPGTQHSRIFRTLEAKGLVVLSETGERMQSAASQANSLRLNSEQEDAVATIDSLPEAFRCVLLNGVTGSGKTEVYISNIRKKIDEGKQSLILVPEIGLTPQLVERIRDRLGTQVAILHSGLTDRERLDAWLMARDGSIPVILGTRSAVWTPLKNPGLIIIDEEHDNSYKQQEGFRYSARDVAIMRGKMLGIPVILGSATPSMESIYNAGIAKYLQLNLPQRASSAAPPEMNIIDMRSRPMRGALSETMIQAISIELALQKQVLLFLNKRGYSPVLMCHECGWTAKCIRCDLQMTYFKIENRIACHHCASSKSAPGNCPECGETALIQVGHGTERLVETLEAAFPSARILRIDRDSTRQRGKMRDMIESINSGTVDILVGTQMLAKGHHFPNLDLVGIIDADRGLFSADFRSSEHMAQMILQVSGRAGRVTGKGRVLLQTHYPDHPLLLSLVGQGYEQFAKNLLEERKETRLPPYSHLALLQAEDYELSRLRQFLAEARNTLSDICTDLEVFGPYPAPLEKRAGRLRYQMLVQSGNRNRLQTALTKWADRLESIKSGRKVRWFLDVDPQDMI